jgi:predicted nucleic acid-binding protein
MHAEQFLDTNVLLYGYDTETDAKRNIAMGLLEEGWLRPGTTAISVQVLQEFYVNFVRLGQTHEEARVVVEDLSCWPVVNNTLECFGMGLGFRDRFRISLWDAMILAAAKTSGAATLYTEDLNDGQIYEGVRVINPFADVEK